MIPEYDKCVLLLPMNAAVGSTSYADYSKTGGVISQTLSSLVVQESTTGGPYGTSARFNSNGLRFPKAVADFSANDGTIEFWYKRDSSAISAYEFISTLDTGTWPGFVVNNSGFYVREYYAPTYTFDFSVGGTNPFVHVSINITNVTVKVFINGTLLATGTVASKARLADNGTQGYIGGTVYSQTLKGWMNDLAIWNGVALRTANFTPPDALCGTISNLGSGVPAILDADGNPAIRNISVLPRGLIGVPIATTSDSGGRYSVIAPKAEHDVIFHDDDAGLAYNDIIVTRVIPS